MAKAGAKRNVIVIDKKHFVKLAVKYRLKNAPPGKELMSKNGFYQKTGLRWDRYEVISKDGIISFAMYKKLKDILGDIRIKKMPQKYQERLNQEAEQQK